jgi:drug/metabolite transporter (DMT)-like permease
MSKNKTVWLALLTMLLWGSLFPMVKLGFSAYEVESTADILLFAGIRFVICGGIICIFSAIKDKASYHPVKHSLVPILLSGVFAIILHYGFTYLGLELTDSSKTALIKQVGVLFYVCFSFIFIKEDKPTAKKIISAVAGFLGIVALNISSEGFSFSVGDVLILCASFCTVFSNVISKNVFVKVAPITSTGISQLFGGIVLLLVGLCMGGRVHFALDRSLFIIVYICVASIFSYCIWFGIVKNGELSKLFIIKFAEPVFACLFGAIILDENIWKIQYLIAFLLISGGIWLSNTKHKKKNETEKVRVA